MTDALSTALWFIDHGWSVFPLAPFSKKPQRRTAGKDDATTDPETFMRRFAEYGSTGYGIVMDQGHIAIDVDRPYEVGDHELPPTLTVRTPGRTKADAGRVHHYYEGDGAHVAWAAGEIRAEGKGYVVGPGSTIKRDDGTLGVYAFVGRRRKLAPMPEWVPRAGEVSAAKVFSGGDDGYDEIPDGDGNNTLARIGGYLRYQGFSRDLIALTLLGINGLAMARDPMPKRSVLSIADSVSRYPAGAHGNDIDVDIEDEVPTS